MDQMKENIVEKYISDNSIEYDTATPKDSTSAFTNNYMPQEQMIEMEMKSPLEFVQEEEKKEELGERLEDSKPEKKNYKEKTNETKNQ